MAFIIIIEIDSQTVGFGIDILHKFNQGLMVLGQHKTLMIVVGEVEPKAALQDLSIECRYMDL